MKLRSEILLVTAVTPIFLLVLYFMGAGAYTGFATSNEDNEIAQSHAFVESWMMENKLDTLGAVEIFSKGIDAAFMANASGAMESRLGDLSFVAAGADILAVYDAQGNMLAARGVDISNGTEMDVPFFFAGIEPKNSLLSGSGTLEDGGMVMIAGNPVMVYSKQLKINGRKAGTAVAGRHLEISDLNQRLGFKKIRASFLPYQQAGSVLDAEQIIGLNSTGQLMLRDENSVRSYEIEESVDGKPALIIITDMPREAYLVFKNAQFGIIVGIAAVGITIMLINFVLMDIIVVMRIEKLRMHATDVKNADNPKYFKAIPIDKNLEDDISLLAQDINGLLQRVVDDKQKVILSEVGHSGKLEDEVEKKNELLEKANEHLRKLEQQKNQFLFNIGHDLKTPLAVIEMNIAILKSPKVSGKQKEDSEGLIKRNMARLKQEIEEIIQLSRYETGSDGTEGKEDVDFCEVVKAEVSSYRDFAKAKKLDMKLAGGDRKVWVRGDHRQLAYALNNLLSNAVKFSVDKDIDVRIKEDDENITVVVTDYGTGVPQEYRKSLFEKFFKGDRTGPGTGVGLFMTKQIAEKHGGTVAYEPGKPKGSVFSFTLPKKKQ